MVLANPTFWCGVASYSGWYLSCLRRYVFLKRSQLGIQPPYIDQDLQVKESNTSAPAQYHISCSKSKQSRLLSLVRPLSFQALRVDVLSIKKNYIATTTTRDPLLAWGQTIAVNYMRQLINKRQTPSTCFLVSLAVM
jgi:hypothetical protein